MLTTKSTTSILPHKSLKININLFPKTLNKESQPTMTNFSQEDYHGEASVAIPFVWESQPGTPKVKIRETPLPPLTPPPSYCYSPVTKIGSPSSSSKNPNLLRKFLPKLGSSRRSRVQSSPGFSSRSSSSSSSSSYSVPSSPSTLISGFRGRRSVSIPRVSVRRSRVDDENGGYGSSSPDSTLCFGRGGGRSRGCYSYLMKVLLS